MSQDVTGNKKEKNVLKNKMAEIERELGYRKLLQALKKRLNADKTTIAKLDSIINDKQRENNGDRYNAAFTNETYEYQLLRD